MATNPLQSAGLRFLQKFGVSFLWATVLGFTLGAGAFFRVERQELEGDLRWHVAPRLWLEQLEWRTVDWRARQLGAMSERPSRVVLVNVDEDTLNNARASAHPEWAMRPWPRELVGQVARQANREGAALVVIDDTFADVSAHQCAPCRGEDPRTDDRRFGELLRGLRGQVAVSFDWRKDSRRPAERPLTPLLLRVGDFDTEAPALDAIGAVLLQRTGAFLHLDGGKFAVWAAATSDAHARELAAALELKGAPNTRPLTIDDDADEMTAEQLLVRLGRIDVGGLDAERVTRAGSLDAPVPALLSRQVQLAAGRLTPDADGVVRSVPLVVAAQRTGDALLPTLALLGRAPGGPPLAVQDAVLRLDELHAVPVNEAGGLTLRWNADAAGRGGRGTLKRAVPAWRLLVNIEDDEAGRGVRHYDNELAGAVVVLVDERSSPVFETPVGPLNRGAIWAQAIANVAAGEGITRVAPRVDFWLTVAFAFVGAVLAVAWSSLVRRPGWLAWVATIAVVAAVHTLGALQTYVTQYRQVAMVAPILACSLTFLASLGYARTLEQTVRDFMLRALGGAVRADVFRRVERDLALMRPERRELTIFISDIEGFTSVSNEKDPQVVVDVLRQYLAEMTPLVLDAGGHVDKYLGDGLMAFWGAPVVSANDAESACHAALKMHARFDEKRKAWEEKVGRKLVLRAGLECGDTVVGEMGTLHRVNYTVMGEPVATAFRLEAMAKQFGVRTLVGEVLEEEARDSFLFRQVDVLRLGREGQPLKVFELLAAREGAKGFEWLTDWEAALALWRARDFAAAATAFGALAEARGPDDLVSVRYARAAATFAVTPPGAAWEGGLSEA